jgi:adenylate cyclase
MADEGFKRKLAAILSADVEGYSRLMDDDEEATVHTLKSYRAAINDLIQQYRGRIVDSPGDNILAEFGSVVDAVNCAVEIQRELSERNAVLAYNRKMEVRIGVNLGDVIEDDGNIYGDGVNIAARVESLAEAGGICISGRAYDQVENKLGLEYKNLGKHQVKNIKRPIRVYRVLSYPGAAAHGIIKTKSAMRRKLWRATLFLGLAGLLLLSVSALVIWNFYFRLPEVVNTSEKKMTFTLPKGPTIAVLPFSNFRDDAELEYFCDGLTESIITTLSGCPKLFVIASYSTFAYKGKSVKVEKIAHDLGVQYVLGGSVQKARDQVRIDVKLVDTTSGLQVWAERFDRNIDDMFALQDEIIFKVITELEVALTEGEQARLRLKYTTNMDAYNKTMQALWYFRLYNRDDNVRAHIAVEEAIALEPSYPSAYALQAMLHITDVWYGLSKSPYISFALANKALKKALAEDNDNADAHMILGCLYVMRRQYDKAISAAQQAIVLNPNGADAYSVLGWILIWSGYPNKAIEVLRKAIRLNPIPPSYYLTMLGNAYRTAESYELSIVSYKKAINRVPDNIFARLGLAACYSLTDRKKLALAEAAEVIRIDPNFSLENFEKTLPYKNKDDTKRWINALHDAGLK